MGEQQVAPSSALFTEGEAVMCGTWPEAPRACLGQWKQRWLLGFSDFFSRERMILHKICSRSPDGCCRPATKINQHRLFAGALAHAAGLHRSPDRLSKADCTQTRKRIRSFRPCDRQPWVCAIKTFFKNQCRTILHAGTDIFPSDATEPIRHFQGLPFWQ